jgi:ubiquinone/menaquinone biosynthesis C-methylase UbiE
MPADYGKVIADLLAFYDLKGKTVLDVGGGGGQLVEFGRAAGRVLALDSDAAALDRLREKLKAARLEDKFEPLLVDFFTADLKADVVLFEFSLHEMTDPAAAVERARLMAPDVVVFDHWPGSPWTFLGAEEDKVARSWASLGRFPVKRTQRHETVQVFRDYEQLYERVKGQGETSLARIASFKGQTDIRIPMPYGLALIEGVEASQAA